MHVKYMIYFEYMLWCFCIMQINNTKIFQVLHTVNISFVRAVPTRSCWLPMRQPTILDEGLQHARNLELLMLCNTLDMLKKGHVFQPFQIDITWRLFSGLYKKKYQKLSRFLLC